MLGLASVHGGDEYEMPTSGDDIVLRLHEIDVHEHVHLINPYDPGRGNRVAL